MGADPNVLAIGLVWYVVFLFSTVLHEASHALAAKLQGDETADRGGQVSLDPIPHIRREPIGMVAVPLLTYFMNGWIMGWASTPYDPLWAERYPHRAARMALAGPLANFLLVLLSGLIIRLGIAQHWLSMPDSAGFTHVVQGDPGGSGGLALFLSVTFSLNLILGVFNLIPVPPLDGSGAISLLMPESAARRVQGFMRQPAMMLPGMLIAWAIFSHIGGSVFLFGLNALYGGSFYHHPG